MTSCLSWKVAGPAMPGRFFLVAASRKRGLEAGALRQPVSDRAARRYEKASLWASRSWFFWTLPMALRGRDSAVKIRFGTL